MASLSKISILIPVLLLGSCMKWEYGEGAEDLLAPEAGLFVVCEGNFQYGNSSLSFYNPDNGQVMNEVFQTANGMKLGDVALSMTIYDDSGWIVVNNSHVIFSIDLSTFREKGRIENLTSPRYIHFLNPEKAYVTQLWDNRIYIVNPEKYVVTGYIEVPGMPMGTGSTEQMVQIGKYVYCSCWSYQNRIIRIDTETDEVTSQLEVGIQPASLVKDMDGKLWTITDGGYEGSPYGYEAPKLLQIDSETMQVVKRFDFKLGDQPRELKTDSEGNELYWINGGVWKMNVESDRLPVSPIIKEKGTKFYGLTINPDNGEIYVADAIDYQQQGIVYRYSASGLLEDEFYTGVNPASFCWKSEDIIR